MNADGGDDPHISARTGSWQIRNGTLRSHDTSDAVSYSVNARRPRFAHTVCMCITHTLDVFVGIISFF